MIAGLFRKHAWFGENLKIVKLSSQITGLDNIGRNWQQHMAQNNSDVDNGFNHERLASIGSEGFVKVVGKEAELMEVEKEIVLIFFPIARGDNSNQVRGDTRRGSVQRNGSDRCVQRDRECATFEG
mgnify:CR=1 FL=1